MSRARFALTVAAGMVPWLIERVFWVGVFWLGLWMVGDLGGRAAWLARDSIEQGTVCYADRPDLDEDERMFGHLFCFGRLAAVGASEAAGDAAEGARIAADFPSRVLATFKR